MKKTKSKRLRLLCLALCGATLALSLTACAKKTPTAPTDTDETVQTEEYNDGLPAQMDYDRTASVLSWKSADSKSGTDWSDGISSDTVNDAVFKSRNQVAKRLNISFDIHTADGDWNNRAPFMMNVKNAAENGTPYDLVGQYSTTGVQLAVEGVYTDLTRYSALDFSDAWWPGKVTESLTIGKSLYFCTGDITPTCVTMIGSVFVNLDLAKSYGIQEDFYGIVRRGEWTLKRMQEIFLDKVGTTADESSRVYGIQIAHGGVFDNLFFSGGLRFVSHDEDGYLTVDKCITNQITTNWFDTCRAFVFGNEDVTKYGSSETIGTMFMQDRSIAYISHVLSDASQYLKEANFDYAVLPYPKRDEVQSDYYSQAALGVTMFAIPEAATNKSFSAVLLQALGSDAYRTMTPEIYNSYFRTRFMATPENAEMLDLIHDSLVWDIGRIAGDTIGTSAGGNEQAKPLSMFNCWRQAFYNQTVSWSAILAGSLGNWQSSLESMNESLG